MICTQFLPQFPCESQKEFVLERNQIISHLRKEYPKMSKILNLINKKAVIESIEYAGNGSFTEEGELKTKQISGFYRRKIVYSYPEFIDISSSTASRNKYTAPKYCWCFDEI